MNRDIIRILSALIFLGNLLDDVISEPIAWNSMEEPIRQTTWKRKERNTIPNLVPSLTHDVAENKAGIGELENRLLSLESKYEALKEKNEAMQRKLREKDELNQQQKRLVAKLKKIVGPVMSSRENLPETSGLGHFAELNPSSRGDDSPTGDGTPVATTADGRGAEQERVTTSPASEDVDENLLADLLRINEYLGNRETEFVALNPNGDELLAASADDFERVSSNPSLYGKAILHLDEQNRDLTDRFEQLLRNVEEFKTRASLALLEARRGQINSFGVNSLVSDSSSDGEEIAEDEDDERMTMSQHVGERADHDADEGMTALKSNPRKVSGKSVFSVASSKSQLGIQDVPQVVKFDYIFSNKGGDFKMENNTFVCSIPGYYYFSFSLRSYDNRYIGVSLMKNDEYQVTVFTDSSERNVMESQSVTLHLDVGDKVWLRLSPSSLFGLYSDKYHFTTFSGLLIYKGN